MPAARLTRVRLTLGQAFALGLAALALLLAGLFSFVMRRSHDSLTSSAASLARARSENAASAVREFLQLAERATESLENQVLHGACDAQDEASVEAHLFATLLDNGELAEATFTHARVLGVSEDGPRLAEGERWQVSVYRATADADSPIHTRLTTQQPSGFEARLRARPVAGTLLDTPYERTREAPPDPTEHPTFRTPLVLARPFVWTDLSFSELDAGLPEERRRVVLTVMKVVRDRGGQVLGVVRVGRLARQIDTAMRRYQVFLCDEQGRLLTRPSDRDRFQATGDDLRAPSASAPAELRAALALPGLQSLWTERAPERPKVLDGTVSAGGRSHLAHFEVLQGTQDWRVGVLLAEDELPGFQALRAARARLLAGAFGLIAAILAGGAFLLRAVGRGLAHVTQSAARLREFDFAPRAVAAPFEDLRQAEESLELAKTAMRAMGKYVPIGLVRELYRTGQEPVLGGELRDVSIMFTDLQGFTSLAEGVSPDELAQLLGRYLEVMTAAIHACGGIVDKYVGDAVMALCNAPAALSEHPRAICAAALRCEAGAQALFASPAWGSRPPLVTRFGLHRATVMVGHFGAPDRLSYTALGDGVNLAARLEGLNKQYGTRILASEDVRLAAGDAFRFRLIDQVAVKGKTQGVRVYELLGVGPAAEDARAERYERALRAYFARDFHGALALAGAQLEDPPSAVLAARCRAFLDVPPPVDWDGTFHALSK